MDPLVAKGPPALLPLKDKVQYLKASFGPNTDGSAWDYTVMSISEQETLGVYWTARKYPQVTEITVKTDPKEMFLLSLPVSPGRERKVTLEYSDPMYCTGPEHYGVFPATAGYDGSKDLAFNRGK